MANESIDKILGELNKVELMLKQFRDTGKIPDIERDIVLGKLRNMYEFLHLIQLQEVKMPPSPMIQKKIVEEVQNILKEEAELAVEIEPEPKIEVVQEFIAESPIVEVPVIEKAPEVSVRIEAAPLVVTHEKEEIPAEQPEQFEAHPTVKKTEPQIQILADKFQDGNSFLNEALAKFQNLQDISRKYQTKPITDISLAISLNDKFLYIKELFGNDAGLYKQTIEILNNSGDFNAAVKYLDEQFQWDFNDFQVQKILELIHRRYMPADE